MNTGSARLVEATAELAEGLPHSVLTALADDIAVCDPSDWQATRSRILGGIPHYLHRTLSATYLDLWHEQACELPPDAVAMALLAASRSIGAGRSGQSVELVWTGPDVGVIPVRLTEQALRQVVEAATQRLTVVSFAVYNVPRICEALLRAADRGCRIRIILETPDGQEDEAAYDTMAALGPTVPSHAEIYAWPHKARPADPRGRRGLMHVKAAIADGASLLVSSANLTEYALATNMELGVLVTGGSLPRDAERQFDRMIETGTLKPV